MDNNPSKEVLRRDFDSFTLVAPEMVEILLDRHLRNKNVWKDNTKAWTIRNSSLGGRGMFATRDIEQGELICVDIPLIVGPRRYSKYLPMCVNCYKTGCPLFPCDKGCGLPVCSETCENSPGHSEAECRYLRKWKPSCGSMWSMDLLRTVVAIRALALSRDEKDLVFAFHCHRGSNHGKEVDLIKTNISVEMDLEEEKFLRRVCAVFDTNSFETAASRDKSCLTSLRGLYPMGALQNHCCTPNTRHHFDSEQKLFVSAAFPIRESEEITMSYTDSFWDTTLRRRHLAQTKHFLCKCKRCADPLEFGSSLGALKCARNECPGSLLPIDPLNFASAWICNKCELKVANRQIKSIHSGLTSIIQEIVHKTPRQILRCIKKELPSLVPESNYIMVDMKFRVVSYFGRTEGLAWGDLSTSELETKTNYCKELLSLLDTLSCGDCTKKGLILYELHCANVERLKRSSGCDDNDHLNNNADDNLLKAIEILGNDVTASCDFSNVIHK